MGIDTELLVLDLDQKMSKVVHYRCFSYERDTRALAQHCKVVGPVRRTIVFAH